MGVARPVGKHGRNQGTLLKQGLHIGNERTFEMEMQAVIALVVGVVVVLFVPALVWSAVISGLLRMARDALRGRVKSPGKPVSVKAE
jgi:hypothetical protein